MGYLWKKYYEGMRAHGNGGRQGRARGVWDVLIKGRKVARLVLVVVARYLLQNAHRREWQPSLHHRDDERQSRSRRLSTSATTALAHTNGRTHYWTSPVLAVSASLVEHARTHTHSLCRRRRMPGFRPRGARPGAPCSKNLMRPAGSKLRFLSSSTSHRRMIAILFGHLNRHHHVVFHMSLSYEISHALAAASNTLLLVDDNVVVELHRLDGWIVSSPTREQAPSLKRGSAWGNKHRPQVAKWLSWFQLWSFASFGQSTRSLQLSKP